MLMGKKLYEIDNHYPRTWPEESNRCHECARGRIRIKENGDTKCNNPDCPSHKRKKK